MEVTGQIEVGCCKSVPEATPQLASSRTESCRSNAEIGLPLNEKQVLSQHLPSLKKGIRGGKICCSVNFIVSKLTERSGVYGFRPFLRSDWPSPEKAMKRLPDSSCIRERETGI